MEQRLLVALKEANFEPPDNICASCEHHGSEHDLDNWCLICPRPSFTSTKKPFSDRANAGWCYFSSMTDEQQWNYGIKKVMGLLQDAGVEPSLKP